MMVGFDAFEIDLEVETELDSYMRRRRKPSHHIPDNPQWQCLLAVVTRYRHRRAQLRTATFHKVTHWKVSMLPLVIVDIRT